MAQPNNAGHLSLASILAYLPAILSGLTAAFAINKEVGHESAAKIVNDSIAAAAAVTSLVPESHVQAISQIVTAVAPSVAAVVNAATSTPAA